MQALFFQRRYLVVQTRALATALLLSVCGTSLPVSAQTATEPEKTWTVNFRETDIQELIRFVAKATERTIIIDDRVKGKVQVISAKPVNQSELYDLFLSILDIYGFAAIDSGGVTRIIPSKDARSAPGPVVKNQTNSESSEVLTEVIQLENISAAKLIPVLRPLSPQQAHMAAYAPSNAIIISDTSANIRRIKQIIQSIDLSAVQKTDIVALEHASAEEVVRMLQQLEKGEAAKGQVETKELVLVADKRTNSVLVSGDELQRQRIHALIAHLDTPLAQSGNVKVVYLEYADAKALADVLSKVVQNVEGLSGNQAKPVNAGNKAKATIEADEGTNSLIITADADLMQSLLAVVERLDIRRAQVLVEAIIVEMSGNDDRDLGVEWLFVNDDGAYGSALTSGTTGGIISGVSASDPMAGVATAISGGGNSLLGVGRLDRNLSFNLVINALQSNDEANILSTPSLLTLDNEEASITVGENIPFVTGSYTSTGSSSSNPDNPFQTVERENVGITLKITPQINEGDSLVLAISQEVSNVREGANNAINGNLITAERKIDTKVLADDGQVIVLGGLIQDQVTETETRVPVLGDIPILGRLFRNTSNSSIKRHLLVFIKPTIVRDKRAMDGATAKKYKAIRDQQLQAIEEGVDLYNDRSLPLLPEWQQQLEKLDEMQDEASAQEQAQESEAPVVDVSHSSDTESESN